MPGLQNRGNNYWSKGIMNTEKLSNRSNRLYFDAASSHSLLTSGFQCPISLLSIPALLMFTFLTIVTSHLLYSPEPNNAARVLANCVAWRNTVHTGPLSLLIPSASSRCFREILSFDNSLEGLTKHTKSCYTHDIRQRKDRY